MCLDICCNFCSTKELSAQTKNRVRISFQQTYITLFLCWKTTQRSSSFTYKIQVPSQHRSLFLYIFMQYTLLQNFMHQDWLYIYLIIVQGFRCAIRGVSYSSIIHRRIGVQQKCVQNCMLDWDCAYEERLGLSSSRCVHCTKAICSLRSLYRFRVRPPFFVIAYCTTTGNLHVGLLVPIRITFRIKKYSGCYCAMHYIFINIYVCVCVCRLKVSIREQRWMLK